MTERPGLELNQGVQWGPTIRPTRAEINLLSVVENSRLVASWAGCDLVAVVKADAYGHGACQVAKELQMAQTVVGFAVSLVEEGIELRHAGITLPILVMGPSLGDSYAALVEFKLTAFLSDTRHIAPLAAAANDALQVVGVHLKLDTGMGRLGIVVDELAQAVAEVDGNASLTLEGIGSHLACADVDDLSNVDSKTGRQLQVFRDATAPFAERGLKFHIANSDAIARFSAPPSELPKFAFARPGIALYGNGCRRSELSQSLRLVSEITQLRLVSEGESVSYGARWVAKRPSRVAIVPIGYADGLPRRASGQAAALIGEKTCEIIGTISMDMIVVDVSDCAEVAIGDEVVLLGRQGQAQIRVWDVAMQAGISEYEVTCGISKRVPRVFVESSTDV